MATRYNSQIVKNGLVLCLDAGSNKSYVGSGTTWNDLSAGKHHATAVNSPTFTNAGVQSYWNFDGINQYFSSVGSENYVDVYAILYLNSGLTIPMLFSQAGVDKSLRFIGGLSASPNTDDWHYSETAKVFVNGSFNQSGVNIENRWVCIRAFRSNSLFSNPFTYQISGVYSASRYFGGKLNLLLAYNRELTTTEVLQNYNATRRRFGL
jgi:hypothetical protein